MAGSVRRLLAEAMAGVIEYEEEEEEIEEGGSSDDAVSVASSTGFETADLPSDEESATGHGSSQDELRLDWDASAPLQPASHPGQASQHKEPSQLETQPLSQLAAGGVSEGSRDDGRQCCIAGTTSPSVTPACPTQSSSRAEESLGESQSQSPSQALFSFGGRLGSLQETECNDESQLQSANQSQNPSQSQSPSQSLWATRQRSASPDPEADQGQSLSLLPPVATGCQDPTNQDPGAELYSDHPCSADPEPAGTGATNLASEYAEDSVPAGFRRIRGACAASHSYTTTRPVRQHRSVPNRPKPADSANKDRSSCCYERSISVELDSHTRDADLPSEQIEGLPSPAEGPVGDDYEADNMAHSVRAAARAESRVQRLCKVKYTRTSFRNRPAATNTGSRLDRVIEKGSKFADVEAGRTGERAQHIQNCEPQNNSSQRELAAESVKDDDQSSANAGADHGGMPPDQLDSCAQAERSIQSADDALLSPPEVAEAKFDWQAWESSEESSDEEQEDDDNDNENSDDNDVGDGTGCGSGDDQQHYHGNDNETNTSNSIAQRSRTGLPPGSPRLAVQLQSHMTRPSRSIRSAPKPATRGLSPLRRVQTRSSQRRSQQNQTHALSATRTCTATDDLWRTSLTIGSRLDAMDSWGKWYEGVVVDTKQVGVNSTKLPTLLRIHFMTWAPRHQEWFDIGSESLQPLNTQAHARCGDAPDYVPPEARNELNKDFRESERRGHLREMTSCEPADTKRKRRHQADDTGTEGHKVIHKDNVQSRVFQFDDMDDGDASDELVSDGSPKSAPLPTRKASPIVTRRKKSPESVNLNKRAKTFGSSWVVGGRWDIARRKQPRTSALLNEIQENGHSESPSALGYPTTRKNSADAVATDVPARSANTKPDEARARTRTSKNQAAIEAATLAAANKSPSSVCDECGKAHANTVGKTAATPDTAAAHVHSPGRSLCNDCARRRAYIRSRQKMGTVVARVTRLTGSTDKSSPARQRTGATKKLFDGIQLCFVDGNSDRSAAADAARDLLASQIRSCGGLMVSLTPKHIREIDHRTVRLVCLASSPNKTTEYMLALAIGAMPLSTEWPARCMQDETLHPPSDFQLPPLRVPGTGSCTNAITPASAIGRILPIERRVLRTAKGRDPLLLGVRASNRFTKLWYVNCFCSLQLSTATVRIMSQFSVV